MPAPRGASCELVSSPGEDRYEETPVTGEERLAGGERLTGEERVAADGPAVGPNESTAESLTGEAPRSKPLVQWLLPATNPAGVIYGMIAIGALLAAESGLRDTYLETIGSAALALALYWLAHSYADLLGQRLERRERLTAAALGRTLLHDWAIMRGGAPPLLALLISWAAGASQETAVTAALWTTVASLLTYELAAGLRARSRPAELLLEGLVGAAMGLGILALRVILH
jgi:hypothetical protein